MRKAGQVLEGNSSTQQLAKEAVGRATEMFEQEAAPLVASEHIMLDSGQRGYINDNDPHSYIYRGGFEGKSKMKPAFANPIEGKGAGAKELQDLDPYEIEQYNRIMDRIDNRRYGTGNLV